jgi:hypothetical protein
MEIRCDSGSQPIPSTVVSLKIFESRDTKHTKFCLSLFSKHLYFVQDRLTVSRDIYPNLSIAISKIYKDGGIGAFYAGISPTLTGMLPYSTCYYFMYETMKTSYCEAKSP